MPISELRDDDLYAIAENQEAEAREELGLVADNWAEERMRDLIQEYRQEAAPNEEEPEDDEE